MEMCSNYSRNAVDRGGSDKLVKSTKRGHVQGTWPLFSCLTVSCLLLPGGLPLAQVVIKREIPGENYV